MGRPTQRLLLLGNLKGGDATLLATLDRDCVRLIMRWVLMLDR